MKTAINICIVALVLFLPAITFPYTLEVDEKEAVHGKGLLEYGGSHRDSTAPGGITGSVYSLNYRDINGEQSYPRPLVYDISVDFSDRKAGVLPEISASNLGIPSTPGEVVQLGVAFLTNLAVHEVGHAVVADYVGAVGSRLSFFEKRGGDFFLGTSSVEYIDDKSKLPYTMGGEFFADLTFEHALQNYREGPNPYNKALLFYSGTDFLWYCFYAFYLSSDNPYYDPVTISKETGISRDMLFSIALAKTILNAYRIYSGRDRIIPYFMVDKYSASLNIMIPFELTR
jgi:hypothetical protein